MSDAKKELEEFRFYEELDAYKKAAFEFGPFEKANSFEWFFMRGLDRSPWRDQCMKLEEALEKLSKHGNFQRMSTAKEALDAHRKWKEE